MNDLQDGDLAGTLVIVLVESRLVIRLAIVTQWLVHRDFYLAIFAGARALDLHATGKVLRDVRAAISIMSEFKQCKIEGLVIPLEAHRQLIGLVLIRELLLP